MPTIARILLLVLLIGCTPRGQMVLYPQAVSVGDEKTVFVGTTRLLDPETGGFGNLRSKTPVFAKYDISIPPDRALGVISWPPKGRAPDPTRDFLTTDQTIFSDATAFRAALHAGLGAQGRGTREAVVFVHGFNNNFAEGLFRIAQLSHDLDVPGVAVHYSWPSAAKPLGYAYDRDSALFARDGLQALLQEVTAAGAERILIVAHSMGAALTMETLRQIAFQHDDRLMSRIRGVVLISPDIDVDVFHAQAVAIPVLPQPFIIFTSRRDRALMLSARLTGQRDRLGNLADVSEVADLKVTVLDVGAFSTGTGHFNVGDSSALIKILARLGEINDAFDTDPSGRAGLLPGAVLTVQNATQIILSPVVAIGQGAVQ